MTNRTFGHHVLLLLLCTGVSAGAQAQFAQQGNSDPVRIEFTPFAGYRFGGAFAISTGTDPMPATERSVDVGEAPSYGFSLEVPSGHQTQWQLFYSRSGMDFSADATTVGADRVDLDIDYLHFGGTYVLDGDRGRPYVGFGLGVNRFSPNLPGFSDETAFGFGFEGGYRAMFSERLGLRFGVRAQGTVVDSQSQIFCSGGCIIRWESDMFWQFDAFVGLDVAF